MSKKCDSCHEKINLFRVHNWVIHDLAWWKGPWVYQREKFFSEWLADFLLFWYEIYHSGSNRTDFTKVLSPKKCQNFEARRVLLELPQKIWYQNNQKFHSHPEIYFPGLCAWKHIHHNSSCITMFWTLKRSIFSWHVSYMPAEIIWIMAFTQIMAIWTPAITLQDHLNSCQQSINLWPYT